MLNYKWVLIRENYAVLKNEDFSDVPLKFKVPFIEIDATLNSYLKGCGIQMFIDVDGDGQYYLSRETKMETTITITAPLYRKNPDTGEYVLIEEAHKEETIDPYEYQRIKETYEECKEEAIRKHQKLFEQLFNQETIDGKCASIVVTKNPLSSDKAFYEKNVPDEYIKVCDRRIANKYYEALYIKKLDAKGKPIEIKTRFRNKGIIVGKGGRNIKTIAKLINAEYINVI